MSAHTLSMSRDFGTLKHLVESSSFSPVLIPLQRCMTPSLPSSPGRHLDHDPFPRHLVYIQGFKDPVRGLSNERLLLKMVFTRRNIHEANHMRMACVHSQGDLYYFILF